MEKYHIAIHHLQAHDPILTEVIETAATPDLTPHQDYYRALVESIIGQQLSVKAAASINNRFVALFDNVFPTPEKIIMRDIEELRSAGLSRPKARYIQDLAHHIIDGSLVFDSLDELSNDEIVTKLTQVKGIGEWTAHMFLMFCMARLDVLPTGDLGIRNGITQLYNLPTAASPDDVERIATENNWAPYQSVASWYIWESLDNAPKL